MSQDATFSQFMRAVDSKMAAFFGLTSSDLEDYPWNDYFEPDLDVDDAASEAVAMWAYDHGFDGNPDTYADTNLVGVDDVANSDAASPF